MQGLDASIEVISQIARKPVEVKNQLYACVIISQSVRLMYKIFYFTL